MDQKNFEKKMEELKTPEMSGVNEPTAIKLAILGARRSAAIGIWFVAVPCYFLFCVFMKYYFHLNLHLFDSMIEMMSTLDKTTSMRFLSPILLVGLPLVAIILNALAIMHFYYSSATKSLQITIKLRWINLLVMLVSISIVAILLLYVIVENAHHTNPS